MALNLVMLGAPGAGKGTQAERFARARGIPRISTGDILREAVHNGTEVGGRAKTAMDHGELVSDELIIGIVRERLGQPDVESGFVLDGFPRTVGQAGALDAMMTGRSPLIVVDITVPESELVRRLASRQVCQDCGTTAGPVPGASGGGRMSRCNRCNGRLVQRSDDNEGIVRVFERSISLMSSGRFIWRGWGLQSFISGCSRRRCSCSDSPVMCLPIS